jgi:hypothetical protein
MGSEYRSSDVYLEPGVSDREQAGTPNVVGVVTLAAVLEALARIGMAVINSATWPGQVRNHPVPESADHHLSVLSPRILTLVVYQMSLCP